MSINNYINVDIFTASDHLLREAIIPAVFSMINHASAEAAALGKNFFKRPQRLAGCLTFRVRRYVSGKIFLPAPEFHACAGTFCFAGEAGEM